MNFEDLNQQNTLPLYSDNEGYYLKKEDIVFPEIGFAGIQITRKNK